MRSIYLLFILSFLLPGFGWSQKDLPDNLPKFDNKWLHFGFQLGMSQNGFAMDHDLTRGDSLIKLETGTQPGLIIHAVSELHFGPHFGLRFTPGIAFAARDLT